MLRELGVVLLISSLCIAGTAVATAPSASISAQESRTIPELEFAIENEQFVATDLTVKDPGETFAIDVSISNADQYKLAIYNTEEQIVTQEKQTGSGSATFDLSGYQAGTYLLVVNQDGTFLAVHPLLVRGYSVDVTAPGQATEGETIEVDADPTRLRGGQLDHVEVFVIDSSGTEYVRTNATLSGGTYVANVDLDGLDAGSYEVYATARGTDSAYGEAEVLGLSEGAALDIAAATPTPTEASSGGGTSGGDGGDTDDDGDASTGGGGASTQTAASPTPTPDATPTPTVTPEASPTVTPSPSPATSDTPIPSVTDDGVTTPASPSPTSSPTDGGGPGFGLLAALIALAGVALLGRRG
jgi:PGF-CTERM protein